MTLQHPILATIEVTALGFYMLFLVRLEAEEFFFQSGMQLESLQLMWVVVKILVTLIQEIMQIIEVNVTQAGTYQVDFRNASAADNPGHTSVTINRQSRQLRPH